MNKYLMPDGNRAAIEAHNPDLVTTNRRTVRGAEYVEHDFLNDEEHRQLDMIINGGDIESQTLRSIATTIYGNDDDELVRRLRSKLSFNSAYQKTLKNGTAVLARKDGTLRVTHDAESYGELVVGQMADQSARVQRYVKNSVKRIDRQASAAVEKVPELAEPIAELRATMKDSLGMSFARQLELLTGDE